MHWLLVCFALSFANSLSASITPLNPMRTFTMDQLTIEMKKDFLDDYISLRVASKLYESYAESRLIEQNLNSEMKRKEEEAEKKLILKDSEVKLKDSEVKLKDSEVKLKEAEVQRMESEVKLHKVSEQRVLEQLANQCAVLCNRSLLESALNNWDQQNQKGLRSMRQQFWEMHNLLLVDGKGTAATLSSDATIAFTSLQGCLSICVKEADVRTELLGLLQNLDAPMHYTTTFSEAPGFYIGGKLPPFNLALGICIAVLMKKKALTGEVYLAGKGLKPFAKIEAHQITKYPPP
jgi:hypothetical protein